MSHTLVLHARELASQNSDRLIDSKCGSAKQKQMAEKIWLNRHNLNSIQLWVNRKLFEARVQVLIGCKMVASPKSLGIKQDGSEAYLRLCSLIF